MKFEIEKYTDKHDCMYCRNRKQSKQFIEYLRNKGKAFNFRPPLIEGRTYYFNYGTYRNDNEVAEVQDLDGITQGDVLNFSDYEWSEDK